MSKLAHEMALKTYADIQKRKKRREEGIKQATAYTSNSINKNRGIRNHKLNGNRVVVPQR